MVEMGEPASASPAEDEQGSLTELLEQLGRDVGALAFYESRLAVARHGPELRLAGAAAAAAAVAGIAFLTAFALANVAAVGALSTAVPGWAAALVLAAGWAALGAVLLLLLRSRARRVRGWSAADAEAARDEAEQAVRATLELLSPVISREIALAAVPVAGDVATGVVGAGEEILESADELVESLTEGVPGGGVVNQVWDVVLMPGRFGVRVATTVLRRGDSGS
jgi:hypothetical protein